MVLSVKMPSRADTVEWLGDDVMSLSAKAAEILKLDICEETASPAVSAGTSRSSDEAKVHPVVPLSSDSESAASRQHLENDAEARRPTDDVDAVTDAVGKLTVVSAAAASNADNKPSILSTAEPVGDAAAAAGAVGGQSNDSLLNMLAQFADETVRPTVASLIIIIIIIITVTIFIVLS